MIAPRHAPGVIAPQLVALIAAFLVGMVLVLALAGFGSLRGAALALGLPFVVGSLATTDKRRKLLLFSILLLPLLVVPIPPRRYGIAISDVLIGLLSLMVFVRVVLNEAPSPFGTKTVFSIPLIALGVGALVSTINSDDPGLASLELIDNVKYVMFYVLFIYLVRTKEDFRTVILLVVAGSIPSILLGLAQFFAHVGLQINPDVTENTEFHTGDVDLVRAFGPFSESLTFAQYLMAPLGFIGAFAVYGRSWLRFSVWASLLGLGALALLCTLSRGSWASFFIAATVVAWLRVPKRAVPYFILWPVTATIAAIGYWQSVTAILPEGVTARIERLGYDFESGRGLHWDAAFAIFRDYPLFGIGLRNLFHVLRLYDPLILADVFYSHTVGKSGAEAFGTGHVHVDNFYLTLLDEVGLAGMIPALAIIFIAVRQSLRNYANSPADLKPYALGVVGAMIGTFAAMVSTYGYSDDRLAVLIWMLLAMTVVLQRLVEEGPALAARAEESMKEVRKGIPGPSPTPIAKVSL